MTTKGSDGGTRPVVGLRLVIFAVALQVVAFLFQLYSILDWDGAVRLGLQEDRFVAEGEEVGAGERARATMSWGNAVADVLWYLPLQIAALRELLADRRTPTLYAMVFAILWFGAYWPLSVVFQYSWSEYRSLILASVLLFGVPSVVGLFGLLVSRSAFLSSDEKKA